MAMRLLISGRVQGVGYRFWTQEEARRLGLDGWVRNRRDGTVELIAYGDEVALEALARACAAGPPSAEVTRVDRHHTDEPRPSGFTQRPTC